MDRHEVIIKRIEEELTKEGFKKKVIYEGAKNGFGDISSFFDLMIDIRLDGKTEVSAQEVWEDMKKQLNYLRAAALKASEDYLRLENRHRDLQTNYNDLLREEKE